MKVGDMLWNKVKCKRMGAIEQSILSRNIEVVPIATSNLTIHFSLCFVRQRIKEGNE